MDNATFAAPVTADEETLIKTHSLQPLWGIPTESICFYWICYVGMVLSVSVEKSGLVEGMWGVCGGGVRVGAQFKNARSICVPRENRPILSFMLGNAAEGAATPRPPRITPCIYTPLIPPHWAHATDPTPDTMPVEARTARPKKTDARTEGKHEGKKASSHLTMDTIFGSSSQREKR